MYTGSYLCAGIQLFHLVKHTVLCVANYTIGWNTEKPLYPGLFNRHLPIDIATIKVLYKYIFRQAKAFHRGQLQVVL